MASKDVEMKASDSTNNKKSEDSEEKKEETITPLTPVEEIIANISLIERAVQTIEPRFTNRVLRSLTAQRRKLNGKVLKDAVEQAYPKGSNQHNTRRETSN